MFNSPYEADGKGTIHGSFYSDLVPLDFFPYNDRSVRARNDIRCT